MTFGERVRNRRLSLNNLSQEDLAKLVGYNVRSAIHKIETNKANIRISDLELYATALNTSPEYLMGWVEDPEIKHDDIYKNVNIFEKIPVVGNVAAGNGVYADNDILFYEQVPKTWIDSNYNYVLLKVFGDSMCPKFEEGDLLLVRIQDTITSGDFGVAIIDGDQGVVKKIFYDKNCIELVSINPNYQSRIFVNEDMNRVRIFGTVKKCIRNINI